MAQGQRMVARKLVGFGAMAAQWPSARITIELGCLGAVAAQEATIEVIGLGAISARINIKIVSLGAISARINIKIVNLSTMAARESNH